MEKLPIEFKEKWISALINGDYKQGRYKMINHYNEYCCLAVACSVLEITSKGLCIVESQGFTKEELNKIPKIIIGNVDENSIIATLVDMNDNKRKSFTEIAHYINENL